MAQRKLADRIFDRVLRNLASGAWRPGAALPPTRCLGREFAVSLTTAQAALRLAARARLLRLRERRAALVRPGATELAGRLLARRAARQERRLLAILIPENYLPLRGNRFYAELVDKVQREAARHRISCRIVPWPFLDQLSAAAKLARHGYGAAMAIGFRPEYVVSLHLLRQQQFPVFAYNRRLPVGNLPAVRIDDFAAAQSLAELLVSLGHRNLCLVSSLPARVTKGEEARAGRVEGWLAYLREHELYDGCLMPVYLCDLLGGTTVFNRAFEMVLRDPGGPTAVVFAHGGMAEDFLTGPRFADLEVPEQLSLATFESADNLPAVPWCPLLTSVTLDLTRTAQCAVELAEKLMGGDLNPPSIRVSLHTNLTGSLGPAPQRGAPAGPVSGRRILLEPPPSQW